ncbi:MAG: CPBP family intramembrane metalloprotease [Ruminococcaceae bacterium]|nr:CPBP family intramembrane metalloprotease [Oscillospiraceae bacterium]
MRKRFEKYETWFTLSLIVVYVAANAYCVQTFGDVSFAGLLVNTLLSVGLLALLLALKRTAYYGLTRAQNLKECAYFLPLLLIVSVNLWNGIHLDGPASNVLLHVGTMLNVGFIEEIIFRGFLFKMMAKNNVKSAVVVSALTFGMGHIINLLNGAELIPTLLQIGYATAIGYLFVVIFLKSQSLVPCILTHSLMNALSIFHADAPVSPYVSAAFLMIVPLLYAFAINRRCKKPR